MRSTWWTAGTAAAVIVLGGCGHAAESPPAATPANEDPARSLPVLADFPGPSWDVALTNGPSTWMQGLGIQPGTSVQPSGCADVPFERPDLIIASANGSVPNGIAGDSGAAAVRIMHDRPGKDLITESVDWAAHCHELRQIYPATGPSDPPISNATAVSVLPPRQVEGTEVTRIHLTDNRANRFQAEGIRESVVSLARVKGFVVVGYRHQTGQLGDDLLDLTIHRLSTGQTASVPVVDGTDSSSLADRTDKELERLLPTASDVDTGWTLTQHSPLVRPGIDESDDSPDCARIPFDAGLHYRSDADRDFREVASVSAQRIGAKSGPGELIRLGLEHPGASVINETTAWARRCGMELLPASQVNGVDVTTVHVKGSPTSRIDFTASLLRVRGILVITKPALGEQTGKLAQLTVNRLQHAHFDTPATGPDPMPQPSEPSLKEPGDVPFPAPSSEDTAALDKIARGTLVDPERYHFGGLLPGDAMTRSSDDYLHFRSPSGAITCTWRKYSLFCDVPTGTFPRTPKPADFKGDWHDSVVIFGWDGLDSGVAALDPVVYAESNVLPYGSTIRLDDDTECLMEQDGLTCEYATKRVGVHLSRTDLTPLAATEALTKDARPLPH